MVDMGSIYTMIDNDKLLKNHMDRQLIYHLSILIDNRWDHYTAIGKTMIDIL